MRLARFALLALVIGCDEPSAPAAARDPATVAHVPRPAGEAPAASPAAIRERICDDGLDEAIDVVCLVGGRIGAVPFHCPAAEMLTVCRMTPPAYAELRCIGPSPPRVTYGAFVAWTSGDSLAIPSSADAPDVITAGVGREERFDAAADAQSAFEAVGTRLRELGCHWTVPDPGDARGYATCADAELWVSSAAYGEPRVLVQAGEAPLLDCQWTGITGGSRPRPRP